ncbi:MAG: thiamine pyrophosphate-dependent enzyme [Oscillospiraceae bacterium]|jgi:2-oxoglutarate ferredoxin oxidoreductase subunit beta|nr:thiamine pyrophosphate-dependent enzyme [Christensenellales bacterium]PWM00540.1 MAG: 2-oxoglutarate oxidoreductase [Clostridiales bacterium]HIR68600.1 2-oxoglutarate oxidoreductase [Candidatus Pelethousia gallinarum]
MKPIFTYTNGMLPVSTHYCPGCTHGIAHRLIMEVLEENGKLGQAIGVAPIGCSVMAHQYMNVDMCEAAHGRAPAVATGIRRVHPDKVVFTYQGDGDLASIGMSEIIAAAARGERFSTFFINNGIYGMTGGQLAPTTLIGQRATTAVEGRTKAQFGMPIKMCELLAQLECAVYVERVALNSPANVRKAKKAVQKAFEVQEKGLGFSFVEFLSTCPTNWGMTPADAMKWVDEKMIPYYPLGCLRAPEQEASK